VAFGEYRLDDVQIGQQGLIIGPRKEPWQNILSASVHPLATRRPLGWAIVRLVLAIPFSLYGVAYAVYATLEPAHSFPEWSVLVTGAIFALIGVLLGGRPIVTCWRHGLYALTIYVAGQNNPVTIRSHRRSAMAARARDINAQRSRLSGAPNITINGAGAVQIGDHNTQNNNTFLPPQGWPANGPAHSFPAPGNPQSPSPGPPPRP
jgi:hypothetical protein